MIFDKKDVELILSELPRYERMYRKLLCTLVIEKAKQINSKHPGITFTKEPDSRELYFGKEKS